MILGTTKELYKADDLPEQMKNDIKTMLDILDTEYGANRDIFHGDGGFVVIVDEVGILKEIKKNWNLDIKSDIYEYEETICEYIKRLFILSSDYSIIAYIKEDLL